jgi:hypothetical protein
MIGGDRQDGRRSMGTLSVWRFETPDGAEQERALREAFGE